jgi:WD40 repeat protein
MSEKVSYVKCKGSASLQPNNLTSNKQYVAYIYRNEVHVIKNDNTTLGAERASSKVCIYNEKGVVTQASLVEFSFGNALVVVTQTGNVNVYDELGQKLVAGHKLDNKAPKDNHLRGIATDGDSMLFVGCGTGEVLVFKVTDGDINEQGTLSYHESPVSACAFADGVLATGDESGAIALWKEGDRVKGFSGNGHLCTSLAAGNGYVAAGFSTGHLRLYNVDEQQLHVEITAHTRTVSAVCMHPNRPLVGVCSEDTFVGIWSLPDGQTSGVKNVLQTSPSPFLITGCQFMGSDFEKLGCTAYDSRYISMVNIP